MSVLKHSAFTLAELLIALAILGVIATFTIPKILQSQQNGRYNAVAKEAAATVSSAFTAYQQKNTLSANTNTNDFTPFLNYVVQDTSSNVDNTQAQGTFNCSGATCYRLHNGAMFYFFADNFAGTATTNSIVFYIDPDGQVTDGTTNGPGKAVMFALYYNGRLTTYGNLLPGTTDSVGTHAACSGCDPPWFSWN